MLFPEYEEWLQVRYRKVTLEPSFIEVGPDYNPTREPDLPPWSMDWSIVFPDGLYIRVKERYTPLRKPRSSEGIRDQFSYHYGVASGLRDSDGHPTKDTSLETIFRIDRDGRAGHHMHYKSEDHISQDRIDGLILSDMDPFKFVAAVLKQRAAGRPFDEVLAFAVRS
jgi:hypothetical protein